MTRGFPLIGNIFTSARCTRQFLKVRGPRKHAEVLPRGSDMGLSSLETRQFGNASRVNLK